jgi:hypothetical protein
MCPLFTGGDAISLCSEIECPRLLSAIDGVELVDGNGWIFHGLRDAFAIFELGNEAQRFQHSRTERLPSWIDTVKIVSGSPDRDDLRISSFRLWSTTNSHPAFPPSWSGLGCTPAPNLNPFSAHTYSTRPTTAARIRCSNIQANLRAHPAHSRSPDCTHHAGERRPTLEGWTPITPTHLGADCRRRHAAAAAAAVLEGAPAAGQEPEIAAASADGRVFSDGAAELWVCFPPVLATAVLFKVPCPGPDHGAVRPGPIQGAYSRRRGRRGSAERARCTFGASAPPCSAPGLRRTSPARPPVRLRARAGRAYAGHSPSRPLLLSDCRILSDCRTMSDSLILSDSLIWYFLRPSYPVRLLVASSRTVSAEW